MCVADKKEALVSLCAPTHLQNAVQWEDASIFLHQTDMLPYPSSVA